MISVGVFENEDFTFSKALLQLSDCALMTNAKKADFDIALISGTLCRRPDRINSKLIIVPDYLDRDLLEAFCGEEIVSYGFCRKNTVTASSLIKSRLAVSLQRKMSDIFGNIIEEQEIITTLQNGEDAEAVLGLTPTLLALGTTADAISRIRFVF